VRQDGHALQHAVDRQRTAWAGRTLDNDVFEVVADNGGTHLRMIVRPRFATRRTIANDVFEVVADNGDTHLRMKVRPAIGRPLRWRSSP